VCDEATGLVEGQDRDEAESRRRGEEDITESQLASLGGGEIDVANTLRIYAATIQTFDGVRSWRNGAEMLNVRPVRGDMVCGTGVENKRVVERGIHGAVSGRGGEWQ
jgi:hypothetical protein